ncbi:hypothetical protein LSH36_1802g00000 [Paralvinella palmiformis]|uniref:Uncharacterized protein n=1 Tax=Paralvinella palmiformis TaxID=53620 RepID=A0AAD9IRW5_9ANNE|nr:hypothetical protein LSH36_1802g00000 [Paralvinella palmiformis]
MQLAIRRKAILSLFGVYLPHFNGCTDQIELHSDTLYVLHSMIDVMDPSSMLIVDEMNMALPPKSILSSRPGSITLKCNILLFLLLLSTAITITLDIESNILLLRLHFSLLHDYYYYNFAYAIIIIIISSSSSSSSSSRVVVVLLVMVMIELVVLYVTGSLSS